MASILLAFGLSNCFDFRPELSPPSEGGGPLEPTPSFFFSLTQLGQEPHPCRGRIGEVGNPLFAFYTIQFQLENLMWPEVRLILRGDSSLDLAGDIPEWTTGHNRAVFANTACDSIQQIGAAPLGNPEAVVISTYGGNEMLHGHGDDVVFTNVQDLVNQTRERWPSARIAGVGIHPMRAASTADRPCEINRRVREWLATLPNTCDVDPYPIFGVACGGLAAEGQMLPNDPLHYSWEMAGKIKDALRAQCGVQL